MKDYESLKVNKLKFTKKALEHKRKTNIPNAYKKLQIADTLYCIFNKYCAHINKNKGEHSPDEISFTPNQASLDYISKDLEILIDYYESYRNKANEFKKALYIVSKLHQEEQFLFIQEITNGGKRAPNISLGEFKQCGQSLYNEANRMIQKIITTKGISSHFTLDHILLLEVQNFQEGLTDTYFAKNNADDNESFALFVDSKKSFKKIALTEGYNPLSLALILQNIFRTQSSFKKEINTLSIPDDKLLSHSEFVGILNEGLMSANQGVDPSDFYFEDINDTPSLENGLTVKLDIILQLLISNKFLKEDKRAFTEYPCQDLLFLYAERGDVENIHALNYTSSAWIDFKEENVPGLSATKLLLLSNANIEDIWNLMASHLTSKEIMDILLHEGIATKDIILLGLSNETSYDWIVQSLLNYGTSIPEVENDFHELNIHDESLKFILESHKNTGQNIHIGNSKNTPSSHKQTISNRTIVKNIVILGLLAFGAIFMESQRTQHSNKVKPIYKRIPDLVHSKFHKRQNTILDLFNLNTKNRNKNNGSRKNWLSY